MEKKEENELVTETISKLNCHHMNKDPTKII